eukprot:CAMPEP_0206525686 /NCGR_PEP_ID=MMETSP0325_2-20121206/193_1 /ASSEMBLY_ACC=CAM_ASM_000347 /TAXON_ID=2866 /ORGANISM="Crypthecodinium cohnii, Strain Seligo" /LENGTH=313 /DNA_ID=CAMNT_0054020537 /DNA_START=208 /DNA_END=1145 /DNA_ORIENTATION=+
MSLSRAASSIDEDEGPGNFDTSGIQDLLNTLTAGAEARRVADLGRAASQKVLTIPKHEDLFQPKWKPPLSSDEVKSQLQGDPVRNYKNCVRSQGDIFSHPEVLRQAKMPTTWERRRIVAPERTFAKIPSQIRYRQQSEAFPEAKDELCTNLHRKWLVEHRKARDKQLHPVYHALVKVDAAKDQVHDITRKKALARDVLSKQHAVKPNLNANEARLLSKVKSAVAVSRMFNKTVGIDRLAEDEAKAKQQLAKARSAGCLLFRPPTPEGQVKHLSGFGPANATSRELRTSTPWISDDDSRHLKVRTRALRGAGVP